LIIANVCLLSVDRRTYATVTATRGTLLSLLFFSLTREQIFRQHQRLLFSGSLFTSFVRTCIPYQWLCVVSMVAQQNSNGQMLCDLKSRPTIGFRVTPDLIIKLCQYYTGSICLSYYWCDGFKVFWVSYTCLMSVLSYSRTQSIRWWVIWGNAPS